ncbi:TRAP transporter small permease [Hoeflea sp.]|uniref:TRAP transporter small permease n=1 Tax=Hoeflea sp. TaxID=1940281 RepID=UPI003B02BC14
MNHRQNGGAVTVLRRWLSRSLLVVVTASLVALIALEVYQITLRYVLAQSLPWGRDVSGLLLFALAWIGMPLIWLERAHLQVVLFQLRPDRDRQIARAIDAIACIAAIALAVCIWQAMESFRFIELPTLGTSAEVRFYPLLAGTLLLACAALLNLLERDPK